MGEQQANKQRLRDLLAAVDAGDLEAVPALHARDHTDHDAVRGPA